MNILDRYKKPTPRFFRILRNLGVSLVTAGGTLMAAPVDMPEWLTSIGSYIIVVGTVLTAVSQAVVADIKSTKQKSNLDGDEY